MMIAAVLYPVEAFRWDMLAMTKPTVIYRKKGRVAHVVLNRPTTGNAIDQSMAYGLQDAARSMTEDDDVAVGIIRGTGDAFCNGSDPLTPPTDTLPSRRVAQALAEVPKPTIAAINGDALGQGLEIALACDLRIVVQGARLGMDQVRRGEMPWDGGTQRLPNAVGKSKAMDMILTGRSMDASEAERIGLVSRIVPLSDLIDESLAVANKIASFSRPAVTMAKEAVNRSFETSLSEGILFERRLFYSTFSLEDQKEGMAAFVEKRTPKFRHR